MEDINLIELEDFPATSETTPRPQEEESPEREEEHQRSPSPPVGASAASDSSDICRICQQTEKETGEPLTTTKCACKGTLNHCHTTCLEKWIRRQRSLRCELCHEGFADIDGAIIQSPTRPEAVAEPRDSSLEDARAPKRLVCGFLVTLLFGLTAISAFLTASTGSNYRQILRKDPELYTSDELSDARFMYGICLAILVFCACITASVLLLLLIGECYRCYLNHFYERPLSERFPTAADGVRGLGRVSRERLMRHQQLMGREGTDFDDVNVWIQRTVGTYTPATSSSNVEAA